MPPRRRKVETSPEVPVSKGRGYQREPELVECPECGLRVERGGGPNGLVWHEHRAVPPPWEDLTPEIVEKQILAQLLGDVRSGKLGAHLALESLARLKNASKPPGKKEAVVEKQAEPGLADFLAAPKPKLVG
jgi:hypothetical protein